MKVHLHATSGQHYELKRAVLIYQGAHLRNSDAGRQAYATVHDIVRTRGRGTRIGPGQPATRERCADLAEAIGTHAAFAGFVSQRHLYMSRDVVAWWRPAAPARMWFACPPDRAPAEHPIGERTGIAPQPPLVFALAHGSLHVWALRTTSRPERLTPLYRAPHFNVWDSGAVCEGNTERPDTVTPDTIERIEASFWNSRFTHPNVTRGLVRYTGGPYALWKHLLDTNPAHFPLRALVPAADRTLAAAMVRLQSRHHD